MDLPPPLSHLLLKKEAFLAGLFCHTLALREEQEFAPLREVWLSGGIFEWWAYVRLFPPYGCPFTILFRTGVYSEAKGGVFLPFLFL